MIQLGFGGWPRDMKPPTGAFIDYGAPIVAGLPACFLLNEDAGVALQNLATGIVVPTALTGGASWTAGLDGPAVLCSNTGTKYIELGALAGAKVATGDYTLECWARIDSASGGNASLIFWGDPASTTRRFAVTVGSTGQMFVEAADGTHNPFATLSGNWADGKWHHWVGVRRKGATNQLVLYRDGLQAATVTDSTAGNTLDDGSCVWRLGRSINTNRCMNGAISLARMWNRALSADEIARLYTDPYGMIYASLRPFYGYLVTGHGSLVPFYHLFQPTMGI